MRVATQLDAETTSPRTDKAVVQEDPSVGTSSMGLATNNYKKQAAHQRQYSPARTTASARRHSVLGDSAATVFRGVPRCASARPARMSAAATLASLPPPRRPTSAASCPGGVYRRPRSGRSVSQLSYADVRSPVAERIRRSPSTNLEPPPPRELVYEGFCRAQNILNRDMLAH
uniref:Uncharacterized protein n=1 Tax=Tetraselmis chuii TaxID=63592 RepID=A0A7S1T1L8_9CHLO